MNTRKVKKYVRNKTKKWKSNNHYNKKLISSDQDIGPYPVISKNIDDNINTNNREIIWGLGIEHQMHLFHLSPNGYQNTNIIFDSYSSICDLIQSKDTCCRGGKCKDYKQKKKQNLTDKDIEWLKNIKWKNSGKSFPECNILNGVPISMPIVHTTEYLNRTLESVYNEQLFLEKKFINLQMLNQNTIKSVELYGDLVQLPSGMRSDIQIPVSNAKYELDDKKYIDYVGSYFISITLPHYKGISELEYLRIHRNFANQLQWIEPLLMVGFFSADIRSVGSSGNYVKGSFKIMNTGIGNLAGSNINKLNYTNKIK